MSVLYSDDYVWQSLISLLLFDKFIFYLIASLLCFFCRQIYIPALFWIFLSFFLISYWLIVCAFSLCMVRTHSFQIHGIDGTQYHEIHICMHISTKNDIDGTEFMKYMHACIINSSSYFQILWLCGPWNHSR